MISGRERKREDKGEGRVSARTKSHVPDSSAVGILDGRTADREVDNDANDPASAPSKWKGMGEVRNADRSSRLSLSRDNVCTHDGG